MREITLVYFTERRRIDMLMIEEMETVVAPSDETAIEGLLVGLILVAIFCS